MEVEKIESPQWLYDYAKENRENMTKSEALFDNILYAYKIPHKAQKALSFKCGDYEYNYIADFVIGDIIIEIDGDYHTLEEQIMKDEVRNDILIKAGYWIIRIKNSVLYEAVSKYDCHRIIETLNRVNPRQIEYDFTDKNWEDTYSTKIEEAQRLIDDIDIYYEVKRYEKQHNNIFQQCLR